MNLKRWQIYDGLIDSIPDSLIVRECVVGIHWVAICSEGVGLAMTLLDNKRSTEFTGSIKGSRVKEIAMLAKSWNSIEASIGIAAINSYHNSVSRIESQWGSITKTGENSNVFEEMKDELSNKKVAIIGHFPALEAIDKVASMSILERNPIDGDYPDPACEYILPHQDYVFITGVTLTNKTLPRLLELSAEAKIVLVGPSVPLSPLLLNYGISVLAGTVVLDEETVMRNICECGDRSIFRHGATMIRFRKFKGVSE